MKDSWPCSEIEWHCTRIEEAIAGTGEEAAAKRQGQNFHYNHFK